MKFSLPTLVVAAMFSCCVQGAEETRLVIEAGGPGIPASPQLYGIFFEDINFAADGGLSAELVKNGSFEFADPIFGWKKIENAGAVGGYGIREEEAPFPNNPHYARITLEAAGKGLGLRNEGYRGMGLRQGARYRFSAMVRRVSGAPQRLQIHLLGARDTVIGSAEAEIAGDGWTRIEAELSASATEARGALRLLLRQPGVIDLEAVSLMPLETWKGHGLRPDLAQLLADLKPGFVRFPGGCIVEGRTLPNRYQWKATIGPADNRQQLYNRWNVEFAGIGKGAADYYQSFRLGFFEYFQLCEDLGAEPLPILNCGMACQYNSGELAALAEMDPYVQDALDLVEFANGPADSPWGRKRAEMGHPAPFGLKRLGIGNEQWGPQYFERYAVVAQALRARHPEIQLVASAGPNPGDGRFQAAWKELPPLPVDIIDEHCYANPDWFLDNASRYDQRSRQGPKIFMGEYAAHANERRNNWQSALAEAAYMTGLERNADVVAMSSYAPLFAHVDAWQWAPDLIWFDNLRAFGTPNYQVQKLFSLNRPDTVLPVRLENAPAAENGQPRLYATAGRDLKSGELVVKIVNATDAARRLRIGIEGAGLLGATGRSLVLAAGPGDENSLETPEKVVPREEAVSGLAADTVREIPPNSVIVLRIPEKR